MKAAPARRSRLPHNYWENKRHQRLHLDRIAAKCNISVQQDWYNLSFVQLKKKHKIGGLVSHYNGSYIRTLRNVYPEFTWHPWLFKSVSSGFWTSTENHRRYLDWVAEQLGISYDDEWYGVSMSELQRLSGRKILDFYGGSLYNALTACYPEKSWHAWLFPTVPSGYWMSWKNRRNFMDWLADELNYEKAEDWYKIAYTDITGRGGRGVLSHYNNAFTTALKDIYPEYTMHNWLFARTPKNFWKKDTNLRAYMEWLGESLGIKDPKDWYQVFYKRICNLSGSTVLHRLKGISGLLHKAFPEIQWDDKAFTASRSVLKSQVYLIKVMKEMLPEVTDFKVCYKHPQLKYVNSGASMELDLFSSMASLAIEYQGQHHYEFHRAFGTPDDTISKDEEKRRACAAAGITLIEIPYWWDYSPDTLRATIHAKRPDLIADPGTAAPIPSVPRVIPKSFLRELPSATRVLTSSPWHPSVDPTGWWMCEEIEGTRVVWNEKEIILPNGVVLQPPDSFIQQMPPMCLDGFLASGRKEEDVYQIMFSSEESKWQHIKFYIFDVLKNKGTLEDRFSFLKQHKFTDRVQLLTYTKCEGISHLRDKWHQLSREGGRAILLRKPRSRYNPSDANHYNTLLRVQVDSSGRAKVDTVTASHLLCELVDGKLIRVKDTNSNSFHEDDIISFSYANLNQHGVPFNVRISSILPGESWATILKESAPYIIQQRNEKHKSKQRTKLREDEEEDDDDNDSELFDVVESLGVKFPDF